MNKYTKNKQYKQKCYNRAKKENPIWNFYCWTWESISEEEFQKRLNQYYDDYETELRHMARRMDKGAKSGCHTAPSKFVKPYNRKRRAQVKNHMRHERYDLIERDVKNADWDYF
jgi:hypothetical protein